MSCLTVMLSCLTGFGPGLALPGLATLEQENAIVSFKHLEILETETLSMAMYGTLTHDKKKGTMVQTLQNNATDTCPLNTSTVPVLMDLTLSGFYWYESSARMTRNATHYVWTTQCKPTSYEIHMNATMIFDRVGDRSIVNITTLHPSLQHSTKIAKRAHFTFDYQDALVHRYMSSCWSVPTIPSTLPCSNGTLMHCHDKTIQLHTNHSSETYLVIIDNRTPYWNNWKKKSWSTWIYSVIQIVIVSLKYQILLFVTFSSNSILAIYCLCLSCHQNVHNARSRLLWKMMHLIVYLLA